MDAAGASAIAAAISAAAAVVAVGVAAATVYLQARWQQPRLRVAATVGMPISASVIGPPTVGIQIANVGRVATTVQHAGLDLTGDMRIQHITAIALSGSEVLPRRLEPGDEITLYYSDFVAILQTVINAKERPLRAYAAIGGGRRFTGKKLSPNWLETWVSYFAKP